MIGRNSDESLLLIEHGRRIGLECKRAAAPSLTPSMRIAYADLKLDRLYVVYPGDQRYALAKNIEAIPLQELVSGNQKSTAIFKHRGK